VKDNPGADKIFDDPFGKYLSGSGAVLLDHIDVLRGALGLTDNDLRRIVTDMVSRPLEDADAALGELGLTLSAVTGLYRYGFLARSLKMPVKDLIALKTLSGINPFTPLINEPVAVLAQDHPYSKTIRFVDIADRIKGSGFTVEDIDFLLRHRYDPLGKYRSIAEGLPAFLGKISAGVRGIHTELSNWTSSPFSEDQLKEKLSLLLPADSARRFSKILSGDMEFEAVSPGGLPFSHKLDSADFSNTPNIRVVYDEVRQTQALFHKGLMTATMKTAILGSVDGTPAGETDLLEELLEGARMNAGKTLASSLHELMDSITFFALKKSDSDLMFAKKALEQFSIRLDYDRANRVQHLAFRGLLTDAAKERIVDAVGTVPRAQSNLLKALLDEIQSAGRELFNPLFNASIGTMLSAVTFETVAQGDEKLDDDTLARLNTGEPAINGLVCVEEPDGSGGVTYRQHLRYTGLLGNAEKARISQTATLLGSLLDAVQKQQVELIATLRQDYLRGDDFDRLFDINGDGVFNVDDLEGFPSPRETCRKKLADSLTPFLTRRMLTCYLTDVFAADPGADPKIIQAFLSDPLLLADPWIVRQALEDPGTACIDVPLSGALGEAGTTGADVVFVKSDGTPVTMIVPSVDTAAIQDDGTPCRPANAASAKFEGWFTVPLDGPYRFYVIRDSDEACAAFRLDAVPEAAVGLDDGFSGADATMLTELKGGIPYRFTFEGKSLHGTGAADRNVRVEIAGENLSRRGLGLLGLNPVSSVQRVGDARWLIIKALLIIRVLGLCERELRYALGRRSLFDDFDFGLLALRDAIRDLERIAGKIQSDNMATGAAPLTWDQAMSLARTENTHLAIAADRPLVIFAGLMRLMDYAAVKKELSPGSDDLISVLENAGRIYHASDNPEWNDAGKAITAHFEKVAALMGREAQTVQDTADLMNYLDSAYTAITEDGRPRAWRIETPCLADERGIRRLWEALRIVERFGLPPAVLFGSMDIICKQEGPDVPGGDMGGFTVARNLRNAVKACYNTEDWRRMVKGISDELRGRKRDALVACIMGRYPEVFTMKEKLFEYFLVDPLMEPVVKTSRIRMALESVRRFIQRCLDGKETWVSPLAIDKEQWKILGRFRFWQANRRIFLHPENWLEPEFRDDKSHLYRELEGTLLQGEVSNELVEDALFKYLHGLDEIARLSIVSMYQETEDDPHEGMLHVIGRTHNLPYNYFYRRFDGSEWTPWEPVDAGVEGDNVTVIMWKQKLHLFWLTFLEKPAEPGQSSDESIESMAKTENPGITKKRIEAQLNWSDYFEGEWRTRQSSEFMLVIPCEDVASLVSARTLVYATKEGRGEMEGAVLIHYGLTYQRVVADTVSEYQPRTEHVPAKVYTDEGIASSFYFTVDPFKDENGNWWVGIQDIGLLQYYWSSEDEEWFIEVPAYDKRISAEKIDHKKYRISGTVRHFGAFRLENKNSPPTITLGGWAPWIPYTHNAHAFVRAGSAYRGVGAFEALDVPILQSGHSPVENPNSDFSLVFPDDPYSDAGWMTMEKYLHRAGQKPFFYQDKRNVFFVKPIDIATLMEEDGWADPVESDKTPEKPTGGMRLRVRPE
ncbi:MAG: hypothetical protein JXA71_13695, partial [Chitinispirillaceae bacterium]|nr:hypothetical protein [Chitinispirillaceae bacterium]